MINTFTGGYELSRQQHYVSKHASNMIYLETGVGATQLAELMLFLVLPRNKFGINIRQEVLRQ